MIHFASSLFANNVTESPTLNKDTDDDTGKVTKTWVALVHEQDVDEEPSNSKSDEHVHVFERRAISVLRSKVMTTFAPLLEKTALSNVGAGIDEELPTVSWNVLTV